MRYRNNTRQLGIAMVEFTIVLPVLLLLLFAVTEIGRALVRYNTLTKAVQDGARYAAAYALLGTTGAVTIDATLQTQTRNIVAYGNRAGTGSPLIAGLLPAQVNLVDLGGDQIRVDASYSYQPLLGVVLPNVGLGTSTSLSFVMQAAVSMRAL